MRYDKIWGYKLLRYMRLISEARYRKKMEKYTRLGQKRVYTQDMVLGKPGGCGWFLSLEQTGFNPKVTIIVPTYNQEQSLGQRLQSIISQTYRNFEILLLDDGSTDESRQVLTAFAANYPDKVRCCFNESHSGSVIKQWKKGIRLAQGELIWIAEADAWCEPDFLEKLIPTFQDESVMISFGRSIFMKGEQCYTTEEYLHDLPYPWTGRFVETTHHLINHGFAYKNIISNAGSAVFRNQDFELFFSLKEWTELRFCGDWLFYVCLARGGKIAYDSSAVNYHHQQVSDTSDAMRRDPAFYQEHELLSCAIRRLYLVSENPFRMLHALLNQTWKKYLPESGTSLDDYYSVQKVLSVPYEKLNILIASYGFCLGGGETFPVYLANEFYSMGHAVTFITYVSSLSDMRVREKLRPSIPVINQYEQEIPVNSIFQHFGIQKCYSGYLDVDYCFASYGRSKDVQHIVTLHGMYECVSKKQLNKMLPILMKNVTSWIYIADKNLIPFRERNLSLRNFHSVPNGLPYLPSSPVNREELGIPEGAFVLSVASRAIPEKGWKEAVMLTERLRESGWGDVHLLLCGNGPVYEELIQQTPKSYIHFVGLQNNVRPFIKASDVFLLPSRFKGESFPLSIIDSIFCSVPIVASDLGEVRSMLTLSDGRMIGSAIPLNDDGSLPVDKFVKAVSYWLNPESRKTCIEGFVELQKRYSISTVAERYEEIYRLAQREY